jgi:cellulose synthase/poly-beta-1,6-N-acetylglucosamine synthase-like glycosyltransferase
MYPTRIVFGMDVLPALQDIYEHSEEPIISYVHDDVEIHEQDWDLRVLKEFEDPAVGVVGFAGAPGFGHPRMYQVPYDLCQFGRIGFRSNMRNAEAHGSRMTDSQEVTILDGFAMFVRREVLDRAGGWPVGSAVGYFCYDFWLCCEARHQGYKIRLVGVDCEHYGGRTASFSRITEDANAAHKYIWDHYPDVLPAMVGG